MAILRKKKNTKEMAPIQKSETGVISHVNTSHVLLHPRVTEKASEKAMNENVYVFEIAINTTKADVRKAIVQMYKVHPVKIATVKIPGKNVFIRGHKGARAGGKKAYIYLKRGDKIEIV
jgi:large subunit ribosomal protein L23